MEYQIRCMMEEDIKHVANLEKNVFTTPWSEKSLHDCISRKEYHFFVADVNGTIAGYIGLYTVLDEGDITNVAVLPQYRRFGIGKGLVQSALEFCRNSNIVAVTLEVRKSNEAAISLYTKLGFEVQGIRKSYYQKPTEDGIIMWNSHL